MNALYTKTVFLLSAPQIGLAPPDEGFEVAFAGRSNAGKSSAINAITAKKALARTSKTPGRTQQLVFFRIDSGRRLVDLPGYGYAKVPAAVKKTWQKTMEAYVSRRRSLMGVFLLMDIRRPLTEFDRQMVRWCDACELPLHIALTKADKLGRGAAKTALLDAKNKLREVDVPVSIQLFSATRRTGIDQAHEVLDRWLQVGGMAVSEHAE